MHVHPITLLTDSTYHTLPNCLEIPLERFIKTLSEFLTEVFFLPFCFMPTNVLYIQIGFLEKSKRNVKVYLTAHIITIVFQDYKNWKAREGKGFMIYRNSIDFPLMLFFFFLCLKSRPQLHPPRRE